MAALTSTRRSTPATEDQDDSRSSSSSTSPAPADNEESDFFLGANDSQSSLGVHNFQDMQVDDACWPPVNRLPNEILISTFARLSATSDLYHCMLVSKRWARNAVDLLWHRPACTNWQNHSSICQTLILDRPFFNYKDFIKRLNLASLGDKVNDGSVQPLANCSRVERLTLTNCKNLTDSGLIALISNSSSLLALDVSNDKNITEESINAIAQHCKRLQGLNISGCQAVTNDCMVTLAQSCRFLKRLKLNECIQLRDSAVFAFADNCPNILEIDLHQCSHIGNGPITSLLTQSNCLRELRLASCDLIDDDAFLSLPAGRLFEHLRILDLTSCTRLTDAAVQKIVDMAPRLRNLVLAKCRNITDVAVYAISTLGKNLHYVHLGHCSQITDDGVKRLVHNCNRIRYIDLGCCTHLTDESVRRLAHLPKLKRIGLVKCSLITDDSVFTLAEAAHRPRMRRDANGTFCAGDYYTSSLERVHLSYCINLTLKSIMRLLNSCPRLTHLSLTGVAAFQRDDFQPYCRQAPPEFTQHQRDVFCVFSGTMVSKFRDFLNTSPQFAELRESQRSAFGVVRHRNVLVRPTPTLTQNAQAPNGEGYDDDMADEENDFDTPELNGGAGHHNGTANPVYVTPANPQFSVNNHSVPSSWPPHISQSIPIPPPAPSLSQQPFTPPQPGQEQAPMPTFQAHAAHRPAPVTPLAYSSFLSNESATGPPPLSAHGQEHASMASYAPSQGTGLESPAQGWMSGANPGVWYSTSQAGASTAPMHGQSQVDGQEGQGDAAD